MFGFVLDFSVRTDRYERCVLGHRGRSSFIVSSFGFWVISFAQAWRCNARVIY